MKRTRSNKQLPKSSLEYVLEGLIPYTDANLKLAFKPGLFFADLENISKNKKSKASVRSSYYRAINKGLVEIINGVPSLTLKGKQKIMTFEPSRLDKNTYLMISFDIPEAERFKRDRLRQILKNLEFKQIQKSIWVTKMDYRDMLKAEIDYNGLSNYIKVFESKEIKL